jgi:hypothetical protein
MPKKRATMPDGTGITSTSYIKFFVENGSGSARDKMSRKSNLIMNLRDMSKGERKKAAVTIIDDELFLAVKELEREPEPRKGMAGHHVDSAVNTEHDCKIKYNPGISNQLIRAAWEARDPWIVDGTTRKEALKKRKSKQAARKH